MMSNIRRQVKLDKTGQYNRLRGLGGGWSVGKFIFENIIKIFRKEERKEGNVLFNDTLNTFYFRLHGIGHVK